MKSVEELRYKEAQVLLQSLNHYLVTLAASLKGRMSPAEEETLASLFQLQLNLQALLAEGVSFRSDSASLVSSSHRHQDEDTDKNEPDHSAHAQAMQYARDLVKAIRQKKEQQRRLELTSQQLIRAEKLATVGQIGATVAHELGNILTPLLMYAKLIYKETADDKEDPEIAEYALQITRIANRASNMLRQLVDAARSERSMMIPVDLTQIVHNTLSLLSPQIKKQGVEIEQRYPGSLPPVMGQPEQLEQVFINIGLNALDAMPAGGTFSINLMQGGNEDGQKQTDFIIIRFSDTGPGILPENIGLLFEPFFTTKDRGAGSGLGLFVSHLIIDQHGGAIEVESEPDQGTTFIIKLPTATEGKEI